MNQVKPVTCVKTVIFQVCKYLVWTKKIAFNYPDVFTHKTVPLYQLNIRRQEDPTQWPYLKDIRIH